MLRKLKVKNYKSLEDLTLPLRPLTVFVGPNNAGKSNILDCLLFLRELGEQGEPAVHSRGGFQQIVWGGELKRKIEIELDGQVSDAVGKEHSVTYRVEIAGGPAHYALVREILSLRPNGEERKLLEFPDQKGMTSLWEESPQTKRLSQYSRSPQHKLYLFDWRDPAQYPVLSAFFRAMSSWAFYDFVPARMSKPGPARKEMHLLGEGQNVSSVLHTFQTEYSRNFEEVEELLKTGIPEVERLLTPLTEEGQTYLALQERGFSQRIPSWAMSDGTLRLLGQLAVLFSPDPPAMACFEEPENCIHPRLLELIVDALKSTSQKIQILVTTHSPDLLNLLAPEDLIIVEKADGKTQCREAKDAAGVKEALKTLGLGELWYSGGLGGVP